ncbi:hypothetical protein Glove_344g45 [Diversispora epigaea]|uniref:Uncharacterized protein n=1 Tax=Diversispora epigaea TaxID=1348612 RepID=A0A397HG00_9GLOM|nr:hypothetical protein Glove_344g45 [Diversispora epigaea]
MRTLEVKKAQGHNNGTVSNKTSRNNEVNGMPSTRDADFPRIILSAGAAIGNDRITTSSTNVNNIDETSGNTKKTKRIYLIPEILARVGVTNFINVLKSLYPRESIN